MDVLNRHDFPSHLTPPTSPLEEVGDDIDTQQNFPPSTSSEGDQIQQEGLSQLTSDHRRLMMRLGPLRQLESVLTKRFKPLTPISPPRSPTFNALSSSRSHDELRVNGYSWKRAREMSSPNGSEEDDESLARVLAACKEDMIQLWNDPVVRKILKEYRVGMEEVSK